MKQHLGDDAELRRYLLGELTQEKRVTVEARLFLDDAYLSQLKAVEDELVDEYAHDELPAGERDKFESHFLAEPEHRADLGIARALKRLISSVDDPEPSVEGRSASLAFLFRRKPLIGFSLAAVTLVVLSFITWFVIVSWRQQNTNRQMQAHEEPTPRPTEPTKGPQHDPASNSPVNSGSPGGDSETAERQRDERGKRGQTGRQENTQVVAQVGRHRGTGRPAQQPAMQVATFLILPGGAVRGEGGARSVLLSSDIRTAVLKLPLADGDEYQSYRATLRTGGRPHKWANLKPEVNAEFGRVVSIQSPASFFREQSYRIELSGVTDDGQIRKLRSYNFRVERK